MLPQTALIFILQPAGSSSGLDLFCPSGTFAQRQDVMIFIGVFEEDHLAVERLSLARQAESFSVSSFNCSYQQLGTFNSLDRGGGGVVAERHSTAWGQGSPV